MNILDQFEMPFPKAIGNSINNVVSSSGYIEMNLETELPIFTKAKKDFTPAAPITHVAISNRFMVVAMSNRTLFRMNLKQPSEQDEISLSKYSGKLTDLFMDPYGNHLLLSFAPAGDSGASELLYLARKSNKIRATTKFKGHQLTAVAWNHNNESENTTGTILLGTTKGLIIETEIVLEGEKFFTSGFSSSLELYWRQVFHIGKGTDIPITGLDFFNVPGTAKYVIFAKTSDRLYVFTGTANPDSKPLLQQVFNKYLNKPERDSYLEIEPCPHNSPLRFWSENLVAPNYIAWITQREIQYKEIDLDKIDNKTYFEEGVQSIKYPVPMYSNAVTPPVPFTLALTEFHVLIAYSDMITGLSLLNSELVYQDNYIEAFGSLINLVKDQVTGTIWAVTENSIFRFKVTKEERNVWHMYCEKQQFNLAKKYSRNNEAHYNQVLIKEADVLFAKKNYNLSALKYAETVSSLEEICLKYIGVKQLEALKMFMRAKLNKLEVKDKTQITMIVLWLVEFYLNELEEMRLQNKEQTNAYFELQKEFDQFLALPKVDSTIRDHKNTFYDLMASHGDNTNSVKMTIVYKDYELLIKQHIYKSNFDEALQVLESQNSRDLFYQFAPILIQENPEHVVKALIKQGRNLFPVKLLPALVSCDGEFHSLHIIKYLEFCVNVMNCNEKAVHNLLLSLYAKYDNEKLKEYLNSQGQEIHMVNYDVYFALRICQEKQIKEACVLLSGLLGLWESAVDMALTISTDLAIQIANQPPQNDVELRKKLWLKIAKHVVTDKADIQTAMDFLHQCDLIKIEDILPFFSDFVTIDHFKDAICKSLKEYNQQIEDLKEEMDEATKSAELVRKEIQSFRNRYATITNCDTCEICEKVLMIRSFYMFPCRHRFHSDCLLKELKPMLGPAKRNKLMDLQRQFNILNSQTVDNISTGSTGMSAKDAVKAEIDNIVASECLYCGENMIRNIDLPFFFDSEYESILKEWD